MVIALCREELHHVITGVSTGCFASFNFPGQYLNVHFNYL
jgi:hypothetical protein